MLGTSVCGRLGSPRRPVPEQSGVGSCSKTLPKDSVPGHRLLSEESLQGRKREAQDSEATPPSPLFCNLLLVKDYPNRAPRADQGYSESERLTSVMVPVLPHLLSLSKRQQTSLVLDGQVPLCLIVALCPPLSVVSQQHQGSGGPNSGITN